MWRPYHGIEGPYWDYIAFTDVLFTEEDDERYRPPMEFPRLSEPYWDSFAFYDPDPLYKYEKVYHYDPDDRDDYWVERSYWDPEPFHG